MTAHLNSEDFGGEIRLQILAGFIWELVIRFVDFRYSIQSKCSEIVTEFAGGANHALTLLQQGTVWAFGGVGLGLKVVEHYCLYGRNVVGKRT